MASSDRSEATSLTKVVVARVRVSRILERLEMSAASRDPGAAALSTVSNMLVRYESKRSSVTFGKVGWRSWKVTL